MSRDTVVIVGDDAGPDELGDWMDRMGSLVSTPAVQAAIGGLVTQWPQMTAAEQAAARLWYHCNAVDWQGSAITQYLVEKWLPAAGINPGAGHPDLEGYDAACETAKLIAASRPAVPGVPR